MISPLSRSARALRRAPLIAAVAFSAGTLLAAEYHARRREDRFPHAKHARLFPVCTNCHAGVPSEDAATRFPAPTVCAQCHNGTDQKRIDWNGPPVDSTNLRFSHRAHATAMPAGDSATCQSCHVDAAARDSSRQRSFMAVARAVPENCLACHAHTATSHLADANRCSRCHVSVVAARTLSQERVAHFPRPPSHDRPDFSQQHATTVDLVQQQCAICHARESCTRCHVNAAALPAVAAMSSDARVARVVSSKPAVYGVPPNHLSAEWKLTHGREARTRIGTCANCHTRPSCTVCHTGSGAADAIRALPVPQRDGPRGVILHSPRTWPPPSAGPEISNTGGPSASIIPSAAPAAHVVPSPIDTPRTDSSRRVVRVHPPGFEKNHRAAATTAQLDCSGCHTQRYCSDCHAGEGRRRFHIANFVSRHAADSYARERDCSSCHSTEAFCKSCHENVGLGATGRRNVAYHTAQSNWLLQHGRAARQGLQSCSSCHLQKDCMQCHSQSGWAISPHGPDFNAEQMRKRNLQMCLACHFSDPLARP